MIGNSLEVRNQLQCRNRVPEIRGNGLLADDHLNTGTVDLALHLIDQVIVIHDFLSLFGIHFHQSIHGICNRRKRQPPHSGYLIVNLNQFVSEFFPYHRHNASLSLSRNGRSHILPFFYVSGY